MNGPCKDCATRYIGCHGSCMKYYEWKEKREAENKKRQKYYDGEQFLESVVRGGMKRCKR